MNINKLFDELAEYLKIQDEIADIVDGLKDQVKAYMIDNNLTMLSSDNHKASYKTIVSNRVDTTALKKELPEVANKYTKQTEFKRFNFV